MSRARKRFIRRVEEVCTSHYDHGRALNAETARRHAGRPDAARIGARVYVRWHDAQHAAIARLGNPPEARKSYRRWLDNMGRRVELERRALSEPHGRARATPEQLVRLKAEGARHGRRFGLQTCTSNHPGAEPKPRFVPFRLVDQPQPQAPNRQEPHQ